MLLMRQAPQQVVLTQQLLTWHWLHLWLLLAMLTWQAPQQVVLTQQLLKGWAVLQLMRWLPQVVMARGLLAALLLLLLLLLDLVGLQLVKVLDLVTG
jgi:hypothetical protein